REPGFEGGCHAAFDPAKNKVYADSSKEQAGWHAAKWTCALKGISGCCAPLNSCLFAQSAASLRGAAGFQRKIGLRAAPTSSRRRTRVVCGAVFTISGFVAASSAMAFMASMKRSHSSLDSDSVGSIIIAPATISGNAVVYG